MGRHLLPLILTLAAAWPRTSLAWNLARLYTCLYFWSVNIAYIYIYLSHNRPNTGKLSTMSGLTCMAITGNGGAVPDYRQRRCRAIIGNGGAGLSPAAATCGFRQMSLAMHLGPVYKGAQALQIGMVFSKSLWSVEIVLS